MTRFLKILDQGNMAAKVCPLFNSTINGVLKQISAFVVSNNNKWRWCTYTNYSSLPADLQVQISELAVAAACHLIIPAKARDYVFTGVGLSVCLLPR